MYSIVALALIIYLIFWVAPEHGTENVLVYLAICSLAGSFTVTSCKVCYTMLCCAVQSELFVNQAAAVTKMICVLLACMYAAGDCWCRMAVKCCMLEAAC